MASACEAASLVLPGILDQALGAITSPSVRGVIDDAVFYCGVREFVIDGIVVGPYRELVAVKLAKALGVLSMVIVTLWVAVQGFNLLSGQGKQAVLPTLFKTGKLVLVLSLVSLLAKESPLVIESVESFKDLISQAVADGSDVTTLIDVNLGITAMLSSINDAIRSVESQRDPNVITSAVGILGQSGPAMLTATLLLLTELSVTLAIMLAPVFIFFLIFQQTAPLFWSWAKFLVGALFSMATLTLVASLALQATALYGATVVAAFYTNSGDGLGGLINTVAGGPFDINASSLRLAALGTLMTAIIVSVPPVIMGFFGAAAAFTTGAMVSMGGAGMLAQQLGAGKGAGMGVPALGGGGSGGAGGGGGGGAGGQLPASQQSAQYLGSQGANPLAIGGGSGGAGAGEAPSASSQIQQHALGARGGRPMGDVIDVDTRESASGSRVSMHGRASDTGGHSNSLHDVQERQRLRASEGELRSPDPVTGTYGGAAAQDALNRNPRLGSGGDLRVAPGGGGVRGDSGAPVASSAQATGNTSTSTSTNTNNGNGNGPTETYAGRHGGASQGDGHANNVKVPRGIHTANAESKQAGRTA